MLLNVGIIRRHLPEYIASYEKIEETYNIDTYYQQAIHENIEEFVARYLPRLNIVDKELAFNNCLLYIKEECAVMCLWVMDII